MWASFWAHTYITCTFFTKFAYNEYIEPYYLSHVVSKIFASAPLRVSLTQFYIFFNIYLPCFNSTIIIF